MTGIAQIYGFPFRIYAESSLPGLEGVSKSGRYRVHVHPPFCVRPEGTPLSPEVPFAQWPAFEWSPSVPKEDRLLPPTGFRVGDDSDHVFDAIRIDFWGPDPHTYARQFESTFLSWIRHLTGQDWVGVYEAHTDSRLKNGFAIDGNGRALPPVKALITGVRALGLHVRPLTTELYQQAFSYTLGEAIPPLYWTLWQDASVYLAMKRMRETILTLAFSLEVARNMVFPRFARTKAETGVGAVLLAPFDSTDLLKHLSSALEKVRNRNLQKEEPQLWQSVKHLYTARHHVAHGWPPVFRTLTGVQSVEDEHLVTWWNDVQRALLWIEEV